MKIVKNRLFPKLISEEYIHLALIYCAPTPWLVISICLMYPYVLCILMSYVSICLMYPYVLCIRMSYVSICLMYPYVLCIHMSYVSVCLMYPYVLCIRMSYVINFALASCMHCSILNMLHGHTLESLNNNLTNSDNQHTTRPLMLEPHTACRKGNLEI